VRVIVKKVVLFGIMNPILNLFRIARALFLLSGIACAIGWLLAIYVAITEGGSLIAIVFATIGGPFFMWVEAIWWGEWLPVLVFYPAFLCYLIISRATGMK